MWSIVAVLQFVRAPLYLYSVSATDFFDLLVFEGVSCPAQANIGRGGTADWVKTMATVKRGQIGICGGHCIWWESLFNQSS